MYKSFTDLNAWKHAKKLTIEVYKLSKGFPTDEKFGITNQIRRASVSVVSNIAEGYGRKTYKDKLRFYYNSLGSVLEVSSQLLIVKDLDYITVEEFDKINYLIIESTKTLRGLIRSTETRVK